MNEPPRYIVIGNLDNRRVGLFVEAARALGCAAPVLFSHAELIAEPGRLAAIPDEPHVVRIDAAGEDAGVERALLGEGYEAARVLGVSTRSPDELARHPARRGEIVCPRQAHLGFERYLGRLTELFAARPSWRLLNPPDAIAELFDKRCTWRRYRELGVPVAEAIPDVEEVEQLRVEMRRRGWREVFVKLSCASSASCLALYHYRGEGAGTVMTSMLRRDDGWFNSLKIRRYDRPDNIDTLLGFLLREGSQVERAIPKARLAGAFFDLRVLVVDGVAAFCVVRQSSHPITNLHLGGWRGDPAAAMERIEPAVWQAAMADCCRVQAAHDCFQVGVDLMFEPDFRRYRILEANAFGDLLPGLTRDGLDVYGWQVRRLLSRPDWPGAADGR